MWCCYIPYVVFSAMHYWSVTRKVGDFIIVYGTYIIITKRINL